MAIEIEKKYRLDQEIRLTIEERLEESNADFIGVTLEENTIFGSASFAERNAVIRLRRTEQRTTLTYKERLPGNSDAKRQIEEETEVADAESMLAILARLGFEPALVYEKRRSTWHFRSVEVVFDELPFGLFMEIEGSETTIKEAEMLLDIESLDVEPNTYPRLTAERGKRNGSVIEARFDPPLISSLKAHVSRR